MFSWDDPNQKVSFIVTTVLVAGSTHCFAGWLIWSVRQREQRLAWFKKLFERKPRDRTGQDTEVGQESGGVGTTTIVGSK